MRKKPFSMGLIVSSIAVLFACQDTKTSLSKLESPNEGGAYDPPKVRTYPSDSKTINAWINAQDQKAIRAHGWDIWESITTTAPDSLPIWENWYSGYEIFEKSPDGKLKSLAVRKKIHDFEFPSQFFHGSVKFRGIPKAPFERPLSFNRFSPSLAEFVYKKQYYSSGVLDSINNAFNVNKVVVANRQISTSQDSTDAKSFALKPVFQFIDGNQPTAVPYWAGNTPLSTNDMNNPDPSTWNQCIVVDPTGKLTPGSKVKMSCNGAPVQDWPVVALKEFYNIKITEAEAKAFSEFAATSGDDVGRHNQGDSADVVDMVKAGNVALLVAMHVTGKEINNWTWQTFWWSPNPYDPVFGNDRPATLKKPWSNYNMGTAYYMTYPQNNSGDPLINFNPYLETNLVGKVAQPNNPKDSVTWYGVYSNCMSCHRLAAWPSSTYISGGNIDPADSVWFSTNTKTDFLWSIATRAH